MCFLFDFKIDQAKYSLKPADHNRLPSDKDKKMLSNEFFSCFCFRVWSWQSMKDIQVCSLDDIMNLFMRSFQLPRPWYVQDSSGGWSAWSALHFECFARSHATLSKASDKDLSSYVARLLLGTGCSLEPGSLLQGTAALWGWGPGAEDEGAGAEDVEQWKRGALRVCDDTSEAEWNKSWFQYLLHLK